MPANIDYDRGVYKCVHPTGVEVFMYADEPGVFRNAFGAEVSEEMGAQSGFEVEQLALQRRKKERLNDAAHIIEQEFSGAPGEREVVEERGGFSVIGLGHGRHIVEDPDGNNLTPAPMPLEAAKVLFDQLVPRVDKSVAKSAPEKPAKK